VVGDDEVDLLLRQHLAPLADAAFAEENVALLSAVPQIRRALLIMKVFDDERLTASAI